MKRLCAFAIAAVALAAPAPSAAATTVTVMTRNVYLGADLSPILTAGSSDEALAGAQTVWSQIRANGFARRARALAAEIAAAKPDVVGLQEAELYSTDRPSDGAATPATTVAQDYLRMLVDALDARGEHYRVAARFKTGDAEVPVGSPPAFDVRASDRIAMLVRRGDVRVRKRATGAYAAGLSVPVLGTTLRVRRGWIAATLTVRGARLVVFNTHLESADAQVRAAQGQELLARVAATTPPVVVLGDLNSGPGADTTVYDALRGAGLDDAWARVRGTTPGLTCCFAADLRFTARPLASRVDLVLYRNGARATRADVVGEARRDRVRGLWPSDHAGVVAKLRVP